MSVGRLMVDVEDWPLVYLRYRGAPRRSDLVAHLAEIERRVLSRRKPFLQVIDQRGAAPPDEGRRALIGRHQESARQAYAAWCVGEVYLTTPAVEAAMAAVFWQSPPDYPVLYAHDLVEALDWMQGRLADSGLDVGAVRRFGRRVLAHPPV